MNENENDDDFVILDLGIEFTDFQILHRKDCAAAGVSAMPRC